MGKKLIIKGIVALAHTHSAKLKLTYVRLNYALFILPDIPFVACADVVVAPPFVYIDQVKNSLTPRIEIASQNSWTGKGGAFTGEIR